MYKRTTFHVLLKRIQEPRRFIQVLAGPRQVGKTTIARQVMEAVSIPVHFATADEPTLRDRTWMTQQWEIARLKMNEKDKKKGALLIFDETQKVTEWSEVIKRLWDEDTHSGLPLKVVLLGSSPLLIQRGLTESLAGRFEIIPVPHWSYVEMRDAFGWNLEQYILYGGYPGAAGLIEDQERWARYIIDSLIETTISRDILLLTRVDKPALLRRLFQLCCDYSGQVFSYQKMLGQLHDAGNTTTLAHYLDLLNGAGLISGLPKFSGKRVKQRSSSPKIQVLNTALMSASSHLSFEAAQQERDYWGRLVESAVGAHLVNSTRGKNIEVFYWLERNQEVDFILRAGNDVVAIEVKSGRRRERLFGIEAFSKAFRVKRQLWVGEQGIPVGEFLSTPIERWLR
ncbi:MAG TPA: ATP-binding protein [Thermodesulfobacteriota bacterium]|nr:ATP-binding protein [Thermodesulfobacteriota bacterium]